LINLERSIFKLQWQSTKNNMTNGKNQLIKSKKHQSIYLYLKTINSSQKASVDQQEH
jgi:hypothetical protein